MMHDEPAPSAGGGAKERRAAPLSLACPMTLLWRFTRALLRDRAATAHQERAIYVAFLKTFTSLREGLTGTLIGRSVLVRHFA